MKKKRLSFEQAEAHVQSLRDQIEELRTELEKTKNLLKDAQKTAIDSSRHSKQLTDQHSLALRTLQDSLSILATQLSSSQLALGHSQDALSQTQARLDSESQARFDLEKQLTLAKSELCKLEEYEQIMADLNQKIKSSVSSEEAATITNMKSQIKALEFEVHNLELDNARIEDRARHDAEALETVSHENKNAESQLKEMTLKLAEMVWFTLV